MVIKPGAMYELAPDGRLMIDYKDVMDMVADVQRLEWLVKNGWDVRFSKKDWRDAIDEAMRGE